MKIQKAKIDGFGKFEEREFTFQKGLNVLYGPNESGKTTLASFLLYSLSGFSAEEIAKYKPWSGKEVGGRVVVDTKDGVKEVELDPDNPFPERLLRREEFEVSSYIPEEGGLEVLSSGVSGVMIARLRRRMEEMEKLERIVDVLKNERNYYSKLEDEIKKVEEKLEEVSRGIDEFEKRIRESKKLRKRLVELSRSLEGKKEELEEIRKRIVAAKITKARQIWEEMDELRLEISKLGMEISDLKKYTRIPQEKVEEVLRLQKEIEDVTAERDSKKTILERMRGDEERILERLRMLREELKIAETEDIDKLLLKVKNLELTMKMIEERRSPKGFDKRWEFFEIIQNSSARITELENTLNRLKQVEANIDEMKKEHENVTRELDTVRSKVTFRNVLTVVFLIAAGVLMGLGYLMNMMFPMSVGAAVSTGLALALFISAGDLRRHRYELEGEQERLDMSIKVAEKKREDLMNEINRMMSGSEFKTPEEMIQEYRKYVVWKEASKESAQSEEVRRLEKELVDGLKEFFSDVDEDPAKLIERLKEKVSEYTVLKDKLVSLRLSMERLMRDIDSMTHKFEQLLSRQKDIMREIGCSSVEDCERILEYREEYERLIKERERKEERMEELKSLWSEYRSYRDMEIPDGVEIDELEPLEVLVSREEGLMRELENLNEEKKRLEENLREVEVEPQQYFSKLGELGKLKRAREMIESEMKVFPEVLNLLAVIKEEIVSRYKSVFEKSLLGFLDRIVGKELSVKVRDDLGLEIEVSGGLESLSRATRDQLELAYKLAMHDALSPEDPYPLVIDNALTRYDDERLKRAVDLIKEIAKTRQVILTTSDKRLLELVPKKAIKELQ